MRIHTLLALVLVTAGVSVQASANCLTPENQKFISSLTDGLDSKKEIVLDRDMPLYWEAEPGQGVKAGDLKKGDVVRVFRVEDMGNWETVNGVYVEVVKSQNDGNPPSAYLDFDPLVCQYKK